MAKLVGEDNVDLVGREFVEQRVAHEDSACAAQAGKHGVGLLGVGAQAEAVNAFDRKAGALSELLHAGVELFVLDWLDLVEEWHDEHGSELAENDADD